MRPVTEGFICKRRTRFRRCQLSAQQYYGMTSPAPPPYGSDRDLNESDVSAGLLVRGHLQRLLLRGTPRTVPVNDPHLRLQVDAPPRSSRRCVFSHEGRPLAELGRWCCGIRRATA